MKVTIDRAFWLRGEGSANSALFRLKDHKQCCLGFMLEQHGVNRNALCDLGTPAELVMDNYVTFEDMPEVLVERNRDPHSKVPVDNTTFCQTAMTMNDYLHEPDVDKERRLRDHFAKAGIELEFI